MILSFAGHRPDKLGGYGEAAHHKLVLIAHRFLAQTIDLEKVISGMALGWDQAVAEVAIDLKIPVIAAIPFDGQQRRWPQHEQDWYARLLEQCAERHVVSPGVYATWKMFKRNEWMVDNSDALVALWDGSSGGTANCVNYAIRRHKPWTNLWKYWT